MGVRNLSLARRELSSFRGLGTQQALPTFASEFFHFHRFNAIALIQTRASNSATALWWSDCGSISSSVKEARIFSQNSPWLLTKTAKRSTAKYYLSSKNANGKDMGTENSRGGGLETFNNS